MALVDVYGEVSPGSELVLDVTSQRFAPLVMELLPRGPAWDREGVILKALVSAEAVELSRVAIRARDLERELDPSYTYELLPDWEASYGLPDCAQPSTLEGRRGALKAKLLAQTGHDQSYSWWASLTALIQYKLWWIDTGPDLLDCNDEVIDPLSQETFIFYLGVEHGADDDLLACLVSKNALLISAPIIHWLWTPVVGLLAEDFTGICCSVKGHTAAVSTTGDIYISSDLENWLPIEDAGAAGFTCVCAAASGVFLAGGFTGMGGICRSSDNGFTWFPNGGAVVNCDVRGISRGCLADDVAVAVGEDGRIFRTANTGNSWAEMVSPATSFLYCVASAIGVIVAAGNSGNGGVFRSFDDGITWEFVAVPAMSQDINAIHGFHDTFVAVGAGGKIFRSTNQGSSWTEQESGFSIQLNGVCANWRGRWTAVGNNGLVLTSTDDGITWAAQNLDSIAEHLLCAGIHRPDGRATVAGANSTLVLE